MQYSGTNVLSIINCINGGGVLTGVERVEIYYILIYLLYTHLFSIIEIWKTATFTKPCHITTLRTKITEAPHTLPSSIQGTGIIYHFLRKLGGIALADVRVFGKIHRIFAHIQVLRIYFLRTRISRTLIFSTPERKKKYTTLNMQYCIICHICSLDFITGYDKGNDDA